MSGRWIPSEREDDYRFLHSVLMETKLHALFKIHERLRRLETRRPLPVQERARSLASDLAEELLRQGQSDEAREMAALASKPHFKSLLSVHDAVAQRDFGPTLPPVPDDAAEDEDEDSLKIVSLVRTNEPLGATIKADEATGAIVVARIMRGGAADRSGLIHEGDELREVNGVSLTNRKPKEIPPLLASSQDNVTFTIVPAAAATAKEEEEEASSHKQKLYVRALFDYDPGEDPAVPCKAATLSFRRGDVLQVVGTEDATWWQARHLRTGGDRAGLIPSQQLQERRVALQRPTALFKPPQPTAAPAAEDVDYRVLTGIHVAGLRRSFRLGKQSSWAKDAERRSRRWSAGLHGSFHPPAYVEVIPYHRDPRDRHRLVVLIGPGGVGVSELKKRILLSDPDRYGVTVPHTTRERRRAESEGTDYHFVSVGEFEELILNHRFIEYGRYKGHYYGTSLDSVHKVMSEGKVCLLDVHPSKMSHVYTSEFKPYVVLVKPPRVDELRRTRRAAKFIRDDEDAAPLRIFSEEDFQDMLDMADTMETQYGHLTDAVIVNGDAAVAFGDLRATLEKVQEAGVQWIPAEWIRSSGESGAEQLRPF